MEISAYLKIKSPRIKSCVSHPSKPLLLVCLYTGEVQLWDTNTCTIKFNKKIVEGPVRTGVFYLNKDWIIVGTDLGIVKILDIMDLRLLHEFKAHDDFIRTVTINESANLLLTTSDDCSAKIWDINTNFTLKNKYKSASHFVMDGCFVKGNNFIIVSLDKKVYMHSTEHTKIIKKFKGHMAGVNTIDFIDESTFFTGSDDHSIIIWDINRITPVTVLKGHKGNVTFVRKLSKGLCSCSEDGSIRFYRDDFKLIDIKNSIGMVWCISEKEEKVFIGCDEELLIFKEQKVDKNFISTEDKIFFNNEKTLFSVRKNELNIIKNQGKFENEITYFTASNDSKYIASLEKNLINIYSPLGMRRKFQCLGKEILFNNTDFVIRNNNLVFYKNFIENFKLNIKLTKLLNFNDEILVGNDNNTIIIDLNGKILKRFDYKADIVLFINNFIILSSDLIYIYNSNYELIKEFNIIIDSYFINNNILYFSNSNSAYYIILTKNNAFIYNLAFIPNVITIYNNYLIYHQEIFKTYLIDIEYIKFQQKVLNNKEVIINNNFKEKAIYFYESLNMFDKALELCSDEDQRFEILLKLNRLDEAFLNANTHLKLSKLGKSYFSIKNYTKSSECFYKAFDYTNLLVSDIFGDKKYLKIVGNESKKIGYKNISFLAYFKCKMYKECLELLKDSEFYNLFKNTYKIN